MIITANQIISLLQKEVNFVCFRDPLFQEDKLFLDGGFTSSEKFVFQEFNSGQTAIFIPNNTEDILSKTESLDGFLKTLSKRETTSLQKTDSGEFQDYQTAFETIQEKLESGILEKVVLSRIIKADVSSVNKIAEAYLNLVESHPNALVYIFAHSQSGIWMGATPEKLIVGKNNVFESHSLAGTKIKSDTTQWSEKEMEEQKFVTDYLVDSLREGGATNVIVENQETIHYQNISHLRNNIQFQYKDNVHSLIEKLHPTPAIAGTPKKESIRLIQEIEKHDRHFYTGYLGLISEDLTSIYVNLRCMYIEDKIASIFVGGGITKKSNLELEWKETENKAYTLLSLL